MLFFLVNFFIFSFSFVFFSFFDSLHFPHGLEVLMAISQFHINPASILFSFFPFFPFFLFCFFLFIFIFCFSIYFPLFPSFFSLSTSLFFLFLTILSFPSSPSSSSSSFLPLYPQLHRLNLFQPPTHHFTITSSLRTDRLITSDIPNKTWRSIKTDIKVSFKSLFIVI